jgi:glycopeptide antibiotics resistance protein
MLYTPVQNVPEPAVLVPLFIIGLMSMRWRLSRGDRFTWTHAALGVITCVYALGVVQKVLLPFPMGDASYGTPPPWHDYINLTPFSGTDIGDDMVPNVLLFMPFGVLLPLLTRTRSLWKVTLTGALVSLTIETLQFISDVTVSAGHAADINDLISNTVGTLVGFVLLTLVVQFRPAAHVAAVLRWPAANQPSWRKAPGH